MTDFLLIHGAWHGGWCWDRLIPALTALGHRASAIDLPGHGADPTPRETVTLAAYGAAVADALRAAPGPVVLVGHSMGGMAISAGAALVPEKVRALVYLTAFLPGDGRSLMSYEHDNPDPRVPPALVPDGAVATVRPEMVRDLFYHDCTDEAVAFAEARLTPQPLAPLADPATLSPGFAAIPKHYVVCTDDRAIVPAMQRILARGADHLHEIAASHSPFLSDPKGLAALLARIPE